MEYHLIIDKRFRKAWDFCVFRTEPNEPNKTNKTYEMLYGDELPV